MTCFVRDGNSRNINFNIPRAIRDRPDYQYHYLAGVAVFGFGGCTVCYSLGQEIDQKIFTPQIVEQLDNRNLLIYSFRGRVRNKLTA